MMYSRLSGVLLGFHGCDEEIGHAVISGKTQLKASENDYDWLGHGVYFWENSPVRAWDFACEQKGRGIIKRPFVVGAILDLDNCMNLMDSQCHTALREAYELYTLMLPESERKTNKGGKDKLLRYLDCAIFQLVHLYMAKNKKVPFDSVRCAFEEGEPSFPGSGILDKTHIQICIRNPICIKGYFHPLDMDGTVMRFNGKHK